MCTGMLKQQVHSTMCVCVHGARATLPVCVLWKGGGAQVAAACLAVFVLCVCVCVPLVLVCNGHLVLMGPRGGQVPVADDMNELFCIHLIC